VKQRNLGEFAIACNGEVYEHFYNDFIVKVSSKPIDDLHDEKYILEDLVPIKDITLDKKVVDIVEKEYSFRFKLVDPLEL
jgi:hypothetical protein